MAVMAELLARGCNVAIPEVDVGEDLFAFRDGQPLIDRIQVKTANAVRRKQKDRYRAEVRVPLVQLWKLDTPQLFYVFSIRLSDSWSDFVVISRPDLNLLYENRGVGAADMSGKELRIPLDFKPESLTSGDQDLSAFRGAWAKLRIFGTSIR
jgi:hypothetical protein